ncbi:MAG TPA: YfiR/HmsC family protein [Acidobacteriota bacterium]|nr:YfiR/HmsC family protein [Acidobacteriota bacterium]
MATPAYPLLRLLRGLCARQVLAGLVLFFCLFVWTRGDEPLPNVAVSLGLKILSLQKQFADKPDGISIYVLGDPNVAKAFSTYEGRYVGSLRLAKVISGDDLPAEKPDVLFVGDKNKVADAVRYTRANKVLSMARNERYIEQGVTLTIYIARGQTQISMNRTGAVLEGVDINPATLKVARVTR